MQQSFDETELTSNEELRASFYSLKKNPAWLHIVKNIEHWKNQCQAEINKLVKEGKIPSAPVGEFEAYGRVLNAPDFFLLQLSGNPGEGPQLDPHPPVKRE